MQISFKKLFYYIHKENISHSKETGKSFLGKLNQPAPRFLGLMASSILVISAASYSIVNRATPKSDIAQLTVSVQSKNLILSIIASGKVVPAQSVNLSPKTSGRLVELRVEQGERVEQGQIVARMDDAELQAQLFQSRANLAQSQAQLNQARVGSRPEEIAQARARLAQAQAKLALARAGSRPEEIGQAKAKVEEAKAKVKLTSERLKRYRYLVQQGAIAQDKLDELLSDARSATATLKEAQQRLLQSLKGTRSEEIDQQQAAVIEVQQALKQAKNGSRPEEIAQRQAAVAVAQGQLKAVEVQLQDTIIRAPFSGIVTQKYATKGAFVTPTTSASSTASATSTSIVAIARGLEILAQVPEVDIGQIKQGQIVDIMADAYPDKVFKGRVHLISPEAVVEQNVTSFQVRVAIDTGQIELRSGMNVDLKVISEGVKNALVVPTVAIVTQQGKTGVLVADRKNKPQFRPVTTGPTLEDQTQVLQGLQGGEKVFIDLPKGQTTDLGKSE